MKEFVVYAWKDKKKNEEATKVSAVEVGKMVGSSVKQWNKAFARTFIHAPSKGEAISYFREVWLKEKGNGERLVASGKKPLEMMEGLVQQMQLVLDRERERERE